MTAALGSSFTRIDHGEALDLLHWVTGDGTGAPNGQSGPVWLLAYCHDGVVWGMLRNSRWQLGSQIFPELSPHPSIHNLLEMRIFSEQREALIWRDGDGFCGRWLKDFPQIPDGPLAPMDGGYLTHGDRVKEVRESFTHVADARGVRQVLPLVLDQASLNRQRPTLHFRQYLAQDEDSGLVRPAAARLTGLTWNGGLR
jgi:CRISPR-associated protein (TIGR03984 family)